MMRPDLTQGFGVVEATGIQRFVVPAGARQFQVLCFPAPAATTPSASHHLTIRGLTDLKVAIVAGPPPGFPGGNIFWVEWDYLEHPYLYGTWLHIPDDIKAVALIQGADAGCVGACTCGRIIWRFGE